MQGLIKVFEKQHNSNAMQSIYNGNIINYTTVKSNT
jgi:hypothetical protein